MRRFVQGWTTLGIALSLLVLSIIPTHVADAQALPQNTVEWAGIYYATTDFDAAAVWVVNYTNGLSLNFGLSAPTYPIAPNNPAVPTSIPTTPGAPAVPVPLPGIPADNFAARYSTNTPFNAGIYEFTVVADGGARLTVNGNLLFDNITATGLQTFTGRAFVGSGAANIILDYVDYGGNAIIEITWDEVSETVFGTGDTDDNAESFLPPTVATGQVNGSVTGLALRTGPYLGASLVAVLRPGQDYTVIAQNNTESSITWYKVVVNDRGQTGWASGRFFDVDLGNVTLSDCAVPPSGGLNVAQTIVPSFSDAGVAQSCLTNVANVLNTSIGENLSTEQLTNVVLTCSAFAISENTPLGALISFVDKAKLVFDIYGVCGAGSCILTDVLILEIASQIVPGYTGTALEALVCFNTLATFFNGLVSQQTIFNLTASCAPLIITDPAIISITTNSQILGFINTIGALICSTTSTPTITLPEEQSVFENLTILPDTGVTIAPRSVMNIRVRPSTRTAEVGNLPWGAEAQLLARTVQAGTDHWYLIRYGGIIGWVDASFINVRGNINDVPIY